jgi:hypothetical protein
MAPWWRRMARRDSGDSGLPEPPFPSVTPDCDALGAHRDCAHMWRSASAAEGEVNLCSRPCHASCPVQGSLALMDVMVSCTCPGYIRMRRAQERVRRDPELVQWMEAERQLHADPEWLKGHFVEVYEAAAAQAAGALPTHIFFGERTSPQQVMESMLVLLAGRYSDAEAARLLGLTETQVAAAVEARYKRMAALAKHERTRRRAARWHGQRSRRLS